MIGGVKNFVRVLQFADMRFKQMKWMLLQDIFDIKL
jgi:hypothetical protein